MFLYNIARKANAQIKKYKKMQNGKYLSPCRRIEFVNPPAEGKFVEDVKEICKTERNILLPVNRKSLTKVIENSNELCKYCDFLVPTKKALELADDKNIICQIAKKVGVPVPKTTSLEEHKDVNEMAKGVNYPCIIKYRNGEATYKINTKMRFTPQSFACFMSHMKKSKHKIKIFDQYLASFFDATVKDGLFALNDVKPYVRYILNTLKRI